MVRYSRTKKTFPHVYNAGKYFAAFAVVVFSIFHQSVATATYSKDGYQTAWLVVFVAATIYQWFWDVKMDWGISRSRAAYLFPAWVYAVFVPADLCMRFLWVLSLIPANEGSPFAGFAKDSQGLLAPAEIVRRLGWCLLRVENEHVSNAGDYRTVAFVPVDDAEEDDEDNKRRRIGWEVALAGACVAVVTVLAKVS